MRLQMTRKKVLLTLIAVLLTFGAIFAAGLVMLTNSEAYTKAKEQVGRQFSITNDGNRNNVRIAWWRPWSYNESAAGGFATFSICADSSTKGTRCYEIGMGKEMGEWQIKWLKEKP